MSTDTKKETSTTPTKAPVEISKVKKRKSFSLRFYHKTDDLSTHVSLETNLDYIFPSKSCVRCGKKFVPTKPEYAWENCCSYTCYLHRDDHKKAPHTKPVDMYSKEGRWLMSFNSSVEAARYVGLQKPDGIRECCLGKTKSSAGFLWRYKEVKND